MEVNELVSRVSSIGLGTKTFVWDSSFDTSIIFDPPLTPHVHDEVEHNHSHATYDQYYYLSNASHDINKLSAALSQLTDNILRVKGYSDSYLLQKVGNRVDIRKTEIAERDYNTAILVIGTNLSKEQLEQVFASAINSQ